MKKNSANNTPSDITDAITILEGERFLLSNKHGDIPEGGSHGFFHRDTRFLSKLELTLNSQALELITSAPVEYFSAAFYLGNNQDGAADKRTVSIIRKRWLDRSLHEELCLQNHNEVAAALLLRICFAADFADLFEVKAGKKQIVRSLEQTVSADGRSVRIFYKNDKFYRGTALTFSRPGNLSGGEAIFQITLGAKKKWDLLIDINPLTEEGNRGEADKSSFATAESEMNRAFQHWENHIPRLECDNDSLKEAFNRSCIDLAALRIHSSALDHHDCLLAAGLPWFMTIFGRDTLISSYQSLIVGTGLARHAVRALGRKQGTRYDDFHDEEPGKILHEQRHGELTVIGKEPYSPYYGSADSTLLFLIVVSEVFLWTGDRDFLQEMRQFILNAVEWIELTCQLHPKGYIAYQSRSSQGIRNQGWKDSDEAIQFFDGSLAPTPIALSEVQGYAYDALLRCSQIFEVLDEPERASSLVKKARDLKLRFNDDFWIKKHGYYALGLDGGDRQIDAACSNMGQLLWSGIVDDGLAAAVAQQLMSDEMYSGWGVRTMSEKCHGFNPVGYHVGTVWPHDNSLIAAGLKRYGFVDEATRIIEDMLVASEAFQHRLPEAFAGYKRGRVTFPARYPTSCSPQAWASGAMLLFLRTMLGLEPDVLNNRLSIDAHLPKSIANLSLEGIGAYGKRFVVRVENGQSSIEEMEETEGQAKT